ncbi:hypothetical protein N2152v2_009948 [Parachlorella kessleri]
MPDGGAEERQQQQQQHLLEAPCPLHACLLRYGITDLAAFSAPRHLALNQEAVSSNVEPKLAALAAEGLSPTQTLQLMRGHVSPLPCSYANVFTPNLQLLRQIVANTDHRPHSKAPHLTAAGKILATAPATAAKYLSRDPSKVQQLLQWLEGSLGIGLVLAQPSVGTLSVKLAERSVGSLAARGQSQKQIQGMIDRTPSLIILDLDSPLQRQKLDWIERVSPWTLDDFLSVPSYFTYSTRRLAARLALLRECGLQPPSTPNRLAQPSSATFTANVRKRLAKRGGQLPWASWAEWEEAWLGTEEGREWGFPPLKD